LDVDDFSVFDGGNDRLIGTFDCGVNADTVGVSVFRETFEEGMTVVGLGSGFSATEDFAGVFFCDPTDFEDWEERVELEDAVGLGGGGGTLFLISMRFHPPGKGKEALSFYYERVKLHPRLYPELTECPTFSFVLLPFRCTDIVERKRLRCTSHFAVPPPFAPFVWGWECPALRLLVLHLLAISGKSISSYHHRNRPENRYATS